MGRGMKVEAPVFPLTSVVGRVMDGKVAVSRLYTGLNGRDSSAGASI